MKYKLVSNNRVAEVSNKYLENIMQIEGILHSCVLKKSIPVEERKSFIEALEKQLQVKLEVKDDYTMFYSPLPLKVIII